MGMHYGVGGMSDYERSLIQEYEKCGYKYLHDTIGEDTPAHNQRSSFLYGVPLKSVLRVQGECIGIDEKTKRGISRWLMFDTRI